MADTLYLKCYVKYRLPIFTARYRMFRPVQWPFQDQPVKDPWFNKSWVVLIVILMPLRSYWKTYKRFWFFSLPIWAKARPMRQEILKGFNPDLADNSITKSDKKLCERSPRLKISAIFTCISHKLQKTVFLSLGRHDSHASQFPLFPIRVRS